MTKLKRTRKPRQERKNGKGDRDRRHYLEELWAIFGTITSGDWAETLVSKIDWSYLAKLHRDLEPLGRCLPTGLADVLRKHEDTLFHPLGFMERDHVNQLVEDLRHIQDHLQWVAELIGVRVMGSLRPYRDVLEAEAADESRIRDLLGHIRETPALARLAKLSNPKRGTPLSGHLKDTKRMDAKRLLGVQAGYRMSLVAALALELSGKHETQDHIHPYAHVFRFALRCDRWANRAEGARKRLEEARDRPYKRAPLKKALWRLWQPHLLSAGRTVKGRPIIRSINSPLFEKIMNGALSGFTPWRTQKGA